jgi:glycosyltransferase involved in cell wall biosynthesis
MSTGIGITTRNRPECLEASLRHFMEFGYGDKIVVIDDNSDVREINEAVIKSFDMPILYKYSHKRLGISLAKNACLWELSEMEHVFLFDDDAWPKRSDWITEWIRINYSNGIGHSLYSVDCEANPEKNRALRAHVQVCGKVGSESTEMLALTNCFGVMLYFTRQCLDAIGGYDGSAANVYGYEHAQISERAGKAGFTNGHKYISPSSASELIYSIDISYNWLGEEPPLPVTWLSRFRSSVTKEEADGHKNNAELMNSKNVLIPLTNPLEEKCQN